MAKRGPKGKNINLELLEKLASIHCTNTEMAAFFGCDSSLLSKPKYSELILKGRERGKISLRRKMMDTAMNGNVTMQIWLSKQYLGMADKQEIKQTEVKAEVVEHEIDKAIDARLERLGQSRISKKPL